jgi:hypothetical protein
MRKFILFLILTQFLLIGNAQIIADHRVVDFYNDIPQRWIDSVKTKLVWIHGMSHGYGYFRGAELLEQMDSKFQVDVWFNTSAPADQNAALRLGRAALGRESFFTHEAGNQGMEENVDNQNATGNPYDFIWFGWSYQGTWENGLEGGVDPIYNIQWAGSTQSGPDGNQRWGLDSGDSVLTNNRVSMDSYLKSVVRFNQRFGSLGYKTKFFFSNGVVDGNEGTELGFQRELKNKHIRDYVNNFGDNNTYFLDYSDILVYNNEGELNTANWDDDGTIRPHQQIHPDNLMDYDNNFNIITPGEDAVEDHIGEVGTVRIAKAMWWLLARASGWDGGNTMITEKKKIPEFYITQSDDRLIIHSIGQSLTVNHYFLYSIQGRIIHQERILNNSINFNISSLSEGIYIFRLTGPLQDVSFKLVVP